jgi:hypothetical protein
MKKKKGNNIVVIWPIIKENIGALTFIGFSILWAIIFAYVMPEPETSTEGIHHNYHYPDEDVMWITGQGDTIWE